MWCSDDSPRVPHLDEIFNEWSDVDVGPGQYSSSLFHHLIPANPAASPFGGPSAGGPAASDSVGGVSLVEAIEKQLGLKLEAQKRTYPVFVIDRIEEKPTDN